MFVGHLDPEATPMKLTVFKLFVLTTAAALSLSASMTCAQQPPMAPPGPPPDAEADRSEAPPPPPSGPRESGREGQGTAKSDWRMPPPSRERGARFRIETGRTVIDLRCADGEPAKDCADLLLQVLDRLQGGSSAQDSDRRDYDSDRSRFR